MTIYHNRIPRDPEDWLDYITNASTGTLLSDLNNLRDAYLSSGIPRNGKLYTACLDIEVELHTREKNLPLPGAQILIRLGGTYRNRLGQAVYIGAHKPYTIVNRFPWRTVGKLNNASYTDEGRYDCTWLTEFDLVEEIGDTHEYN